MSDFSSPGWLLLLVVIAALVVGYGDAQRRRRRHLLRFTNLAVLERVVGRAGDQWIGWSRHLPAALLGLASVLLVIGLAGPTAMAEEPRDRATVVLAIDVSLSMEATDVAPNRLVAAQEAAIAFTHELPENVNLGLIGFAGTATVLQPPTLDREAVRGRIEGLQLAEATATGEAIHAALGSIAQFDMAIAHQDGGPPPARIVLLTDGARTVGRDEFDAAREAAEQRVPISAISFGTAHGVIDLDGQRVPVPADEEAMREVARISGGEYFGADTADGLRSVYEDLGRDLGYEVVEKDVSGPWLATGTVAVLAALGAGLLLGVRLPA